jgi:hypothetical protein
MRVGSSICFRSVCFGFVSLGKKKGRARGPPFFSKEATQNFRDAFYNMLICEAQDALKRRGVT